MPEEKKPETSLETITPASQEIIDRAKRESHQWLNPETWRTMQIVAATFLQSGAMPKSMDTAPKLMVALQAGKEAGLQPLEAINSFYFVNGKVSMYGDMAITQVIRAGHKVEWGKCDDNSATVKITRGDNGAKSEVTFTMAEANRKGLSNKEVWQKFPGNMLRFKAFHTCARFLVPDALHGVPIKEVFEAEVIEDIDENLPPKVTVTAPKDSSDQVVPPAESLEAAINKPDEEDPEAGINALIGDDKDKPVEVEIAESKKVKNGSDQKESPAMKKMREAAEQSGMKL